MLRQRSGYMHGFFARLKKRVISVLRRKRKRLIAKNIDDKIALGVLLWGMGAVAGADKRFLPEEDKKIRDILSAYTRISKKDFPVILTAIKQAAISNVDFYKSVSEAGRKLSRNAKIALLENLFRLAYTEGKLDRRESLVIKKIARLFGISEKTLKKTNLKVKRDSFRS